MGAWGYLAIAIFFEIIATSALKLSDGFDRLLLGLTALAAYGVCFTTFSFALRAIPVGVAYAIWSGVGILVMAIIGAIAFDQKLSLIQILFMLMILVSAVGLGVVTKN